MLTDGYFPASLMQSAIVPILKDRQGDTSDKNNYRPIAIVTAPSKIFELRIMNPIESHLLTQENQFGFKKNILLTCVYLLLSLQLSIIICITVPFIVVFLMLQRIMIE